MTINFVLLRCVKPFRFKRGMGSWERFKNVNPLPLTHLAATSVESPTMRLHTRKDS